LISFFVSMSFLAMKPYIIRQLLSRASSYMTYGLNDDAVRIYKKAIRVDPINISSHLSLGTIFLSEKKYAEAIPHLEKIRALGPGSRSKAKVDVLAYHRSSLKMLIICYGALKEIDKKNGALKELERYYPNDTLIKDMDKKEGLFKQ